MSSSAPRPSASSPAFVSFDPDLLPMALEGRDALAFLDAVTSQDFKTPLGPREARAALWLTPQGRIRHSLIVLEHAGHPLALIPRAGLDAFVADIRKFRLKSEVAAVPTSHSGVWHGWPAEAFTTEGAWADPRGGVGVIALDRPRQGEERPLAAFTRWRWALGVFDHREWGSGEQQPLEFGASAEAAISFTKGCFPGQELVARQHNRGLVKYAAAVMRGETPLAPGDAVMKGEAEAGRVIATHAAHENLSLVRLRQEYNTAQDFTANGQPLARWHPQNDALLSNF